MGKRGRKSSLQIGETMEKVFKSYGHEVGDGTSMQTTSSATIGRKQRRREAKLLKKKRMRNTGRNRENDQGSITTNDTGCVDSKRIIKINPAKKKSVLVPKKSPEDVRKEGLKVANSKEDKVITALEKKLYLNKRKGKNKLPKSFVDAGLDYILDVVGGGGSSFSDNELGKVSQDIFFTSKRDDNPEILEEEEELGSEFDEGEENNDAIDAKDSGNNSDEDFSSIENDDKEEEAEETSKILSNPGGKYIPPAMRVKFSDEQEERVRKLKRRLKGLLNRLSDANMSGICNDVEAMYRESSRAIMHKVLTEAILEQFCTPDPIPETLISENAMLIAILSSRVGTESLLHFYEVLSLKLHSLIQTKDEVDSKASNNLIQMLSYLYQLKTIDCKVVLDVFHILINSFTEKDIELILEILNKTGFQLRKDNPESLRNIIQNITSKCEDLKTEIDDGSRISYMMNILMAVKNNNIRKVTGYDPDKVTARRKKLAQLTKNSETGSGNTMPPVTLQDFLDIEKNGRWWIVGSSFSGRPMLKGKGQDETDDNEGPDFEESVSKRVADAARMQRMNTDVRRKIFYAIMTADDFVDAFEKVLKCGLKGKQLREIATVVVDCCQQGKSFNPYYVHLLNRFCQHDRQFAISIQCTLWDRFKVLESMKQNQMENIAKLLSQLIIMEDLSLNCLKAINFTEMNKTMIKFLRLLLCTLVKESSGVDNLRTICTQLRASSKTKLVRQGLHLFLQYFMLSDEKFMANHSELQEHFQAMLSTLGRARSVLL